MPTDLLYADCHLLLARKAAGMPAQPDPSGQADLLSEVQKTHPTAHLIHRLDTPTGGVMVFGLSGSATARLSALVQDHERFRKEYLAVLSAPLPEAEGELVDLLYHDKRQNKAFVADSSRKGAKEARLTYRTVATTGDGHTLVTVRLHTGRTHQIRIQFASRGLPLCGDGKYGSRDKCPFIGLWAYRLTFPHPMTEKTVMGTVYPDSTLYPWSLFHDILSQQNL